MNEENKKLDIKQELGKYLMYWKAFVLFTIIALSAAYIHLRYATPIYKASTTIMIKDDYRSGTSTELAAFEDLGIIGKSGNNVDNETQILMSRRIIGNAIKQLNLDVSYFFEGRVKTTELYKTSPIALVFKNRNYEYSASFIIDLLKETDNFQLKDLEGNIIGTHQFNETITLKVGDFIISKTDFYEDNKGSLVISISNLTNVIDAYKGGLQITPLGTNTSALNLSINHPVIEKAEDFLNELVSQYNADAIQDKNEVSQKTKEFIDERLLKVGDDLAKIEDDIKNYKKENKISGLSTEGELNLEKANQYSEELIKINTELSLGKSILEDLKNNTSALELLPQDLGFSEISLDGVINEYNILVNNAKRLKVNAGNKNPRLLLLQGEISALKTNLVESFEKLVFNLQNKSNQLNKKVNNLNQKVSSIPVIERGFIDISRHQQIISGLFTYLLTKKEETAISLAVTVSNAKIIDVAYSSKIPIAPNRKGIYLGALLFGLFIPFISIFIKNFLDNKIHSKKDIEALTTIPFIGDIPRAQTDSKIVIAKGARTSTAEAFRLIRTNLNFMMPDDKEDGLAKTIFITSSSSGEGKSFISINLSAALELSNKKVLLIGMDLRAPKITEYLGISERKGVTNFITNTKISLDEIKFTIPECEGLDIICSGAIPPNPAELLLHDKIEELFTEAKKDYDYIIVDTAPVNMVTDTLLISKYADITLYVTRANYLDKQLLNVPQTLYKENKLPNMAILLNDTDLTKGYGYGGYGYGGYGYGYGNSYVDKDQVKKPWYKKIFN